jgi:hypothetical protein
LIGDEEVWPFGQVLAIEAQIELHAKHNHQPTNQSNHNAHQATYSLGQLVEIDAIEAKHIIACEPMHGSHDVSVCNVWKSAGWVCGE